jgi:hypothetical protein
MPHTAHQHRPPGKITVKKLKGKIKAPTNPISLKTLITIQVPIIKYTRKIHVLADVQAELKIRKHHH